ncbi:RNA-binding domain-containing protein [Xylaria sp. FL1777]|nr:RNA-binding domain-containing protein [Xylaria sp. FL1777]
MYCVRRAALRAACSSSRFVVVPRQQIAAIAMQISKANAQPAGSCSLPRYFSQTAPVAEEGESAVEKAIREGQEDDSTVDDGAPLQSSANREQEGFTVFVSNVSFDATETHLNDAFGKYGEIRNTNIGRDGRGLSRGFAFITFTDKAGADRAVQEAHNSFWHGRRIMVDHRKEGPNVRKKGGPMEPTKSLYIGNIPYETSDADLNRLFRSLHNVKDVRVAIDRNTGWPRGFAHADFVDVESAIKAYEFLREYSLGGRSLRVDYAETRRTGPGAN